MIKDITITASSREGTGKGPTRRLRAKGMIPAAVYGEGGEASAVAINAKELARRHWQGAHSPAACQGNDSGRRLWRRRRSISGGDKRERAREKALARGPLAGCVPRE